HDARPAHRLALIDADIETPTIVQLPALCEAKVGKCARTVLGRLLIEARLQLRALPRYAAHADTRHIGSEAFAIGVLILREEARFGTPVIVHADDRPIREVDTAVLAAERKVLRCPQRDPVVEQVDAAIDEGLLRLRRAGLQP